MGRVGEEGGRAFAADEVVEAALAALVAVDECFDEAFAARLHDQLVEGLHTHRKVSTAPASKTVRHFLT